MKSTLIITLVVLLSNLAIGQIDLENRIKNKVNQRVEQKVDHAIDKTLDKTEEEAKDAAKGDKNKKAKSKKDETSTEENTTTSGEKNETSSAGNSSKPSLKTYGKFDFIPGEKIIALDEFSNVAIGDFPLDWNTNSGGEIVNIEGESGKWLMLPNSGIYMPEYITELPENFTLEYDLICNEDFSFYSTTFNTWFASMKNPAKEFNGYNRFDHPANAVKVELHPTDAGSQNGTVGFKTFDASSELLMENIVTTGQFKTPTNIKIHVSIWRQKNRMRVYLNEEKVLDLPRAFDPTVKYNKIVFMRSDGHHEQDKYILGNLRFAVGAPDTRSKLITEGKLVTRGILFDSGSEKIKPESFGTLKDIATVLTENPDVKVQIVGHTDSDGDEAKNLELSKKRAQAVKEALSNEFKIDSSRMETNGQGESQPSDKNDTPAGKANNRRVEFIKL